MQTSALTKNRAAILPLTSARFFAASYVVLLHMTLWNGSTSTATWGGRFFRNGYVAVGFFFVLSGYILAHVYVGEEQPVARRKFWTARFARVYPLLFVSLLVDSPRFFEVKLDFYGHDAWLKALAHTIFILASEASLAQAWLGARLLWINGPSWSLSDEAFFYLIFPFVAFKVWGWARSKGWLSIFYFWAGAMVVPALMTWLHPEMFVQIESSQLQWAVMLTPIFRVFEFLSGIALCSLQMEFEEKFQAEARNMAGYVALGLASALFIMCIAVASRIPFLMMFNGLLLPVFVLMIFGLVNVRGWLAAVLSNKVMLILGEASFAMYLLHWPLYSYLTAIYPVTSSVMWTVYWMSLLGVSLASLFFLERPARRWILSKMRPMNQDRAGVPKKLEGVGPLAPH